MEQRVQHSGHGGTACINQRLRSHPSHLERPVSKRLSEALYSPSVANIAQAHCRLIANTAFLVLECSQKGTHRRSTHRRQRTPGPFARHPIPALQLLNKPIDCGSTCNSLHLLGNPAPKEIRKTFHKNAQWGLPAWFTPRKPDYRSAVAFSSTPTHTSILQLHSRHVNRSLPGFTHPLDVPAVLCSPQPRRTLQDKREEPHTCQGDSCSTLCREDHQTHLFPARPW